MKDQVGPARLVTQKRGSPRKSRSTMPEHECAQSLKNVAGAIQMFSDTPPGNCGVTSVVRELFVVLFFLSFLPFFLSQAVLSTFGVGHKRTCCLGAATRSRRANQDCSGTQVLVDLSHSIFYGIKPPLRPLSIPECVREARTCPQGPR